MRPLLGITRDQIENYAGSHQLAYLNDGSNDDTRYDRNFLRHEVLPLIESRWPGYRSGFTRSAALSGELAASDDFDNLTQYTRYGGPYLPIDAHDAKSLHRALAPQGMVLRQRIQPVREIQRQGRKPRLHSARPSHWRLHEVHD